MPRTRRALGALACAVLAATLTPAVPAAAWTTADNRITVARQDAARVSQVVTVLPDGRSPVWLTQGGTGKQYPAMSRDGSRVAYTTADRLEVVEVATRRVQVVVHDPAEFFQMPQWVDADTLVFGKSEGYDWWQDDHWTTALYTVDLLPSGLAQPVPVAEAQEAFAVAVSPDGSRLAYSQTVGRAPRSPEFDVWTSRVDGTDRRQLTSAAGREVVQGWHPTRGTVLFSDCSPLQEVADAAGSAPRRLTTFDVCSASFSTRDPAKLAYQGHYTVRVWDTVRSKGSDLGKATDRQPDW